MDIREYTDVLRDVLRREGIQDGRVVKKKGKMLVFVKNFEQFPPVSLLERVKKAAVELAIPTRVVVEYEHREQFSNRKFKGENVGLARFEFPFAYGYKKYGERKSFLKNVNDKYVYPHVANTVINHGVFNVVPSIPESVGKYVVYSKLSDFHSFDFAHDNVAFRVARILKEYRKKKNRTVARTEANSELDILLREGDVIHAVEILTTPHPLNTKVNSWGLLESFLQKKGYLLQPHIVSVGKTLGVVKGNARTVREILERHGFHDVPVHLATYSFKQFIPYHQPTRV